MGRASLFEMFEGSRPLGVGSGLCSDLRIDGAGVAMVHLELSRSGDSIWLSPRADGDVRVNAAHVGGSCKLSQRSLIEFLEHEIEVLLHTNMPSSRPQRRALEEDEDPPPVTLGAHWLCAVN
ncbi:MAG: FHA domain-containing protein [Polyangiaceae bacterium]